MACVRGDMYRCNTLSTVLCRRTWFPSIVCKLAFSSGDIRRPNDYDGWPRVVTVEESKLNSSDPDTARTLIMVPPVTARDT